MITAAKKNIHYFVSGVANDLSETMDCKITCKLILLSMVKLNRSTAVQPFEKNCAIKGRKFSGTRHEPK
jgi:hypothetical protein